mmetsp:Transcript_136657/g.354288  ORF Transcript_136657/g.354288 Transcript_136657/m.354288 type:complete len:236 (+) Transcript_136657:367-1074(+)
MVLVHASAERYVEQPPQHGVAVTLLRLGEASVCPEFTDLVRQGFQAGQGLVLLGKLERLGELREVALVLIGWVTRAVRVLLQESADAPQLLRRRGLAGHDRGHDLLAPRVRSAEGLRALLHIVQQRSLPPRHCQNAPGDHGRSVPGTTRVVDVLQYGDHLGLHGTKLLLLVVQVSQHSVHQGFVGIISRIERRILRASPPRVRTALPVAARRKHRWRRRWRCRDRQRRRRRHGRR